MKILTAAAAMLALSGPAFAFDPAIAEIVATLKPKAMVDTKDLAALMQGSERWCYKEDDGSCSWSDVYLQPTAAGPRLEVSSAIRDEYDLYFFNQAIFLEDRYSCEYGYDWSASARLTRRSDGTPVNGRELDAVRVQLADSVGDEAPHCFDYLFVGADTEANTVTLLQRSYMDMVKVEGSEVPVTLHFDAADANALTLRAD